MTTNSNPSEKITHGVSILLQGKDKAQAQTLLLRGYMSPMERKKALVTEAEMGKD